jgi:hypothetical protein
VIAPLDGILAEAAVRRQAFLLRWGVLIVAHQAANEGIFRDHVRTGRIRIIHAFTFLQLATLLISRGDLNTLFDAYGFGISAAISLKATGLIVARYRSFAMTQGSPPSGPDAPTFGSFVKRGLGFHEKAVLALGFVATIFALIALLTLLTRKTSGYALLFALCLLVLWRVTRKRDSITYATGLARTP